MFGKKVKWNYVNKPNCGKRQGPDFSRPYLYRFAADTRFEESQTNSAEIIFPRFNSKETCFRKYVITVGIQKINPATFKQRGLNLKLNY